MAERRSHDGPAGSGPPAAVSSSYVSLQNVVQPRPTSPRPPLSADAQQIRRSGRTAAGARSPSTDSAPGSSSRSVSSRHQSGQHPPLPSSSSQLSPRQNRARPSTPIPIRGFGQRAESCGNGRSTASFSPSMQEFTGVLTQSPNRPPPFRQARYNTFCSRQPSSNISNSPAHRTPREEPREDCWGPEAKVSPDTIGLGIETEFVAQYRGKLCSLRDSSRLEFYKRIATYHNDAWRSASEPRMKAPTSAQAAAMANDSPQDYADWRLVNDASIKAPDHIGICRSCVSLFALLPCLPAQPPGFLPPRNHNSSRPNL